MPFIAIRNDGEGRVYINEYDNPKVALNGVEFACQDCGAPMIIRSGDFVQPHFAHMPGYEDRPCWYRREGESEVHREAKQRIASALANSPYFAGAEIEVEYPIDTAAGRRYIDVYMELPDGRRYAHEAQISGQTIAAFEERRRIDRLTLTQCGGSVGPLKLKRISHGLSRIAIMSANSVLSDTSIRLSMSGTTVARTRLMATAKMEGIAGAKLNKFVRDSCTSVELTLYL